MPIIVCRQGLYMDTFTGIKEGKTMVDEISEIFKKFTDEDNEIVRRFIEMDPDGDDRKVHNQLLAKIKERYDEPVCRDYVEHSDTIRLIPLEKVLKYWGFTKPLRNLFPNTDRDCSRRKILITDVLLEKLKDKGKTVQQLFALAAYDGLSKILSPIIKNWIYKTSYGFYVYPYGGRIIFDDVDMGFLDSESDIMSYYIVIDFDINAVGKIHKCLSLRAKYHGLL